MKKFHFSLLRLEHVVVELVGASQISVDPGGQGGQPVDVHGKSRSVVRHAPERQHATRKHHWLIVGEIHKKCT